jgi:hypothetical protein
VDEHAAERMRDLRTREVGETLRRTGVESQRVLDEPREALRVEIVAPAPTRQLRELRTDLDEDDRPAPAEQLTGHRRATGAAADDDGVGAEVGTSSASFRVGGVGGLGRLLVERG